tara:strand:- start:313 stop:567 length:255 start_codon:yes stop_codon:yes gene_type:complete
MMVLQNKKDTMIIRAGDKSKLLYAISIADSLIKSKDSHKISVDLASIWRVCGYYSKEKFYKLFKQYKGMTLNEYCKKLNPSCNC